MLWFIVFSTENEPEKKANKKQAFQKLLLFFVTIVHLIQDLSATQGSV